MKKSFVKGALLASSVFVLAACSNSPKEEAVDDASSINQEIEKEESKVESIEEDKESIEDKVESKESKLEDKEESKESKLDDEKESLEEEIEEDEEELEAKESVALTEYIDGEYVAVTEEDDHGWYAQHIIEVEDGEIVSSTFDYYNEQGLMKSEDEEYVELMKETAKVDIKKFMEDLDDDLVKTQDPEELEVVSGATDTFDTFKKTAKALVKAAKEGKHEEITVK